MKKKNLMCYFGSKLLQNIAAMHICELILLAKFILLRERKRKKKKNQREKYACLQ